MEDRKLRAVNPGSDQPTKVYGSKEDDNLALKTLSQIQLAPEQCRENLVSEIMKSLGNLSEVKFLLSQIQSFSFLLLGRFRESLTPIYLQKLIALY